MAFDVRTANLAAINSLTKYPSIPTYHKLDPRNGTLLEEPVPFDGMVIGTEKIDGVNGRIVLLPDGTYLIGSRENLLYAQGDLIGDRSHGIVDALRPVADSIGSYNGHGGAIQVLYLEVYGGRKLTGASPQYTSTGQVGVRLFDAALIPDAVDMLDWPAERIAAWRDNGGQPFLNEDELDACAGSASVDTVPCLFAMNAVDLPTDVEGMAKALATWLPASTVGLDRDGGRAEGVVLRTFDRGTIAKVRFQNYERTLTLRRRANGQ